MYKVNVDGAKSDDDKPSSIGMIIRGDTIAAMCMTLPGQYMSLEIETIALEKGVILAKEMGLQQIMIESDALTVVQSLAAGDKNGCLGHLLQGISDNLSSFNAWQINHLKKGLQQGRSCASTVC